MAGGGGQESTTTTGPWSGATPYLLGDPKKGIPGVLPTAAAQFQSGEPSYFPGSTVAGFAPEQSLGMEMGANRAAMGSPLNTAAGAETLKTLGGGYLGESNPYLSDIRSLGEREASRVAGQFGAGGRTGSGAMQGSIAEGYSSATAPYFFNAYENERNRMGNAAQFAPQLAAEDYRDIDYLRGIGAQRQGQGQAELGDEVARWNFDQTIDQQKLRDYADLIRGTTSGFNTTTGTTPGPSPLQQGLGAAAGAASMAAKFASSQALKERMEVAAASSIVEKLVEMPIYMWSYKGDSVRHLGPTAEEFSRRFGVGNGREIHLADVCGVLLCLGQAIAQRLRS